ncbi:class I tRNA ligase family protein [Cohnella faecalis]|uniref:class I tRNA ligase family protein n=1 Tax=Cohnella faecalis TaxID=2315694 RepID=UPI002D78E77F|nr:class I tRNA ligase family protein [Cohnella faecalis]
MKDLQEQQVCIRIEEHVHQSPHSERSVRRRAIFVYAVFVSMKPLAEKAIDSQKSGTGVQFVPDRFEKIYLHYENVRDWCISRQLWWGHRIPACTTMQRRAARRHGSSEGSGEPVLHGVRTRTFSTRVQLRAMRVFNARMPDDTKDLQRYYPTDVLVTGYDIIYFWLPG